MCRHALDASANCPAALEAFDRPWAIVADYYIIEAERYGRGEMKDNTASILLAGGAYLDCHEPDLNDEYSAFAASEIEANFPATRRAEITAELEAKQ